MGGNEKFTYTENNKKFQEYFSDEIINSEEAKDILRRKNNDEDNIFKIGEDQLYNLRKIIGVSLKSDINTLTKKEEKKLENISNPDNTILETFGPGPTKVAASAKNIQNNIENKEIFSESDIKDFAALVKAESLGEPKKGMVAVAFVILNRMKKGKTLKEVIYKKTSSGKNEFSPVSDGRLNKMKKSLNIFDIKLIKDVISGKYTNPIGNATFFQTKKADKTKNWQSRMGKIGKLKTTATIGNHIFRREV